MSVCVCARERESRRNGGRREREKERKEGEREKGRKEGRGGKEGRKEVYAKTNDDSVMSQDYR